MFDPVPSRRAAARSGIRPSASPAPIDVQTAVVTFVASWFAAQLLSVLVLSVAGYTDGTQDAPIGVLAAALAAAWTAYLVGVWSASQRAGSGDIVVDYVIEFRAFDLIGIGIGLMSQLVLVTLVYVPLERLWPGTFSDDKIQDNAQDLVDSAGGAATVALFALVVVGAPIVEELVYRGLLQRSLAGRFDETVVVIGVALLFAGLHFRAVEFPGLFAFGLVLGFCALRTGRLGLPIVAHMAFNATGLFLAL